MQSFVFKVMERFFSKLSKFSRYSLVDWNQRLKRSDPFAKKKDANRRKGVVGTRGSATPTAPIPRNRKAKVRYKYFSCIISFLFWYKRHGLVPPRDAGRASSGRKMPSPVLCAPASQGYNNVFCIDCKRSWLPYGDIFQFFVRHRPKALYNLCTRFSPFRAFDCKTV